ncbi:hypothetical protein [Paraburkholderia rhynchosiae]|uniref:hypothetical protein n=1 Tax=Paraburkholderia rhynchosiae TaxID=487049 RepID=UPI003899344F
MANDLPYSLSGRALGTTRAARRFRTRQIDLNCGASRMAVAFGGCRQSGNGCEIGVSRCEKHLGTSQCG